MESGLRNLLPKSVSCHSEEAEAWHHDELTQGESHSRRFLERSASMIPVTSMPDAIPAKSISFVDFFASHLDDMYQLYPYETKRDIRQHLRERLISWVSQHAREFFGPSTSRAISACLRGHNLTMADVERFAELVSFLLDAAIQVGPKTVVWHGYDRPSRVPLCSLGVKSQGVFVTQIKI